MLKRIAHFISYKPKLVMLIATLLLIPSIIGYANTFVNYDILSYLPSNLKSVQGEHILENTFNNASMSMVLVKDMPSKYTKDLKEKISKIDGVASVTWVDDIADITIPVEALPDVIKSVFYSKDESYTLMLVQYENKSASEETMHAIKEIRSVVNEKCLLSGLSVILSDTKSLADKQAPLYVAIAIILALIALSFCVESWFLPIILLLGLGYAVIYNMGTNLLLGQISYITQCIAAILQLGVTMDYSIFLLDRYNEEKVKFPDKRDAMAHAIVQSFVALISSSGTTLFGFVAMCFMTLTLGLDIGIVMAKGVVFGIITVILVLPAMILLGDKLINRYKHKSINLNFEKVNNFVVNHKKSLAITFLVLFIPAIWTQSKVSMYYDMTKAMPQDMASIVALNTLKKEFNMATTHFVIVDDDLPAWKLSEMENKISDVSGVSQVLAYNSFVDYTIPDEVIPDSIKDMCKKDGKQLIMINSSFRTATDESIAQINSIKKIISNCDSTALLTGEGILTNDLISITSRDFKVTSIISIVAIFAVIAIAFNSISIPVFLILSIELAILINKGFAFILGTTIPFIAPTIISCVQLGATVDYAILLTSRFREEMRNGHDKITAMRIAGAAADKSIFQSAIVFFSATFGVYLISNISIIKSICALLARGSVISAIIIIFLLKPILIICEKFIAKTTYNWYGTKIKRSKSK